MEKFDPYHKWLCIPPEEQPPNHYRLLGIHPFESDPDVIDTGAEKQTVYLRSCATGAYVKESQRLLNEVAAARRCLLDSKKKAAYDADLRAATEVSDSPSPEGPASSSAALAIDTQRPKRRKVPSDARSSRGGRSSGGRGLVVGVVMVLLVVGAGIGLLVASRGSGPSDRKVEDGASRVRIAGNPDKALKSSSPSEDGTSSNDPGSAKRPAGADRGGEAPLSLVDEPSTSTPAATEDPAPPFRFDTKTEMPVAESPEAVAIGPEPAVEDMLPAPPKGDELARAEAQVQDIFRNDFANAKKPSDKRVLAQKLLANARKSTTDADRAAKYVMLRDAWTTAAESGDAATAHAAIRALADTFDVDATQMTVEALTTAARVVHKNTASSPDDFKSLATAALEAIDEALENDDPGAADKLLALATGAARRLINNDPLRKRIEALEQRIKVEREIAAAVAAARTTLASNPNDAAANLALGRYLCFHEQDWEQGVKHFAKSGDPQLARIAGLEASKPTEPARQIELADAWWGWIESQPLAERKSLHMAAQYWYALAQPGATGLQRTKVDKRLNEDIGKLETYRSVEPVQTKPALKDALADSLWNWWDRTGRRHLFRMNRDGSINPSWHPKKGKWEVASGTQIRMVVEYRDRRSKTITVDLTAGVMTTQSNAVYAVIRTPTDAIGPFRKGSAWVSDTPRRVLTVTERNGEVFRAKFVHNDWSFDRELSGTIKGDRVSWLAKDVRVARGDGPGQDTQGTLVVERSGTAKIDFTYGAGNASGTFSLRLQSGAK